MNEKNYYKVVCKCGHVGKMKYIPIAYAVCAESAKSAETKARKIPRVKHDAKDAIIHCRKITYEEYLIIKEINDNDPYLRCRSDEDAEEYDFSERIKESSHKLNKQHRATRHERILRQLKIEKILRRSYRGEAYEYLY